MKKEKYKNPGDMFNEYQKLKFKKKVEPAHEKAESTSYEAKEESEMKEKKKNWIAGAIKKPGALHKEMGVKEGKKIPAKALAKAAKKGGKLGKRARLAETLKGFKKHKSEFAPAKLPKKNEMAYKKVAKKKC